MHSAGFVRLWWAVTNQLCAPAACLQLSPGLSAATGLAELSIKNSRMSLEVMWEQLTILLPRWQLLKVRLRLEKVSLDSR